MSYDVFQILSGVALKLYKDVINSIRSSNFLYLRNFHQLIYYFYFGTQVTVNEYVQDFHKVDLVSPNKMISMV